MLDNSAKDVAMARWNNGVERVIISRCHIINCLFINYYIKIKKNDALSFITKIL
jgi:hypothetical protein